MFTVQWAELWEWQQMDRMKELYYGVPLNGIIKLWHPLLFAFPTVRSS